VVDEDQESRGFKVHDRRRFSASGDAREDAPEVKAPEPPPAPPTAEPEQARPAQPNAFDEVTFSTFVIGLVTQALLHLGEIADERGPQTDLPAAKHLIDILGMLQAKTRGNLDKPEMDLLEQALYDLRMRFVERSRSR
jgi:hypothetical protein